MWIHAFIIVLQVILLEAEFLDRLDVQVIKIHQQSLQHGDYANPALASFEILRRTNRCGLYPRCLLFDCCPGALLTYSENYIEQNPCLHNFCNKNECIDKNSNLKRYCNSSVRAPLAARTDRLSLFHETITEDSLVQQLHQLPPTDAAALQILNSHRLRKIDDDQTDSLKVLYLVQGDFLSKLPGWYKELRDMIYLSYVNKTSGCLFFPNSTYGLGRTALYLAARQLELSQGWLYDYFIFLDDDALIQSGSISAFEQHLHEWNPAVAAPLLENHIYGHRADIDSVNVVDYIMIAYHREVVEMLHPFIQEFDRTCTVSSQLMQSFEISLVYRNHQLTLGSLRLRNELHRGYPLNCDEPMENLFEYHRQTTPPALKHCVLPDIMKVYQQYSMGSAVGYPFIKMFNYSLSMYNRNRNSYAQTVQLSCHSIDNWDANDSNCCSIDNYEINQDIAMWNKVGVSLRALYPHHGTVLYDESISSPDQSKHWFVWGNNKFHLAVV